MILIGLDIASYKTGYFVLETNNLRYKIGTLEAKGNDLYDRIRQMHDKSKSLFNSYKPDIIVIENTFLDEYRKHQNTRKRGNINTLKTLEKIHGAIIANTKDYMDIHYLNPSEHKTALTGMGNATKQSTIWAIQKKLGLTNVSDDEADAAALILTYLVKNNQWELLEKLKRKYEN